MKLDNIRRIIVEDFNAKDRELVENLANNLNPFMESVVNTVNGNISIENLDRQIITVKVKVGTTGVPLQVTKFTANAGMRGSNIISVSNNTNPAKYVTSAPFMSFTALGNGIYTVKSITGLAENDDYSLLVELIP